MLNLTQRLLRRSFRVFVHSPATLLGAAEAEGLSMAEFGRTAAWEFAALRRGT